jgi:hypothetical protein
MCGCVLAHKERRSKHSLWETQAMSDNEENYEMLMMNRLPPSWPVSGQCVRQIDRIVIIIITPYFIAIAIVPHMRCCALWCDVWRTVVASSCGAVYSVYSQCIETRYCMQGIKNGQSELAGRARRHACRD